MKISMTLIDDIKRFTKVCQRYDADIFLKQGRHIVNAKSILGIFSLDPTSVMEVTIEAKDSETEAEFYDFTKKWEVKE